MPAAATATAAGGRFRSSLGRALFQTAGLFQSVLQPDIATNKVGGREVTKGCVCGCCRAGDGSRGCASACLHA